MAFTLYELTWTLYDQTGPVRSEIGEPEIAALLRDNAQGGNTGIYALSENSPTQYRMEIVPNPVPL